MLNSVELFQEIICVPPTSKIEKKAYFLRELQIDLFIGDTEADFESAQLANVQFCGVSTGQRSKEYLDSIGVANIDGNVMDLIHF
jgi:phosphoglycolate phosphatase-like HAD superfamily hydrolase